jgi:hypothetical protein
MGVALHTVVLSAHAGVGEGGGQSKNPTPLRRGVSTTNCRKQDLDGPEEPNDGFVSREGHGDIVRLTAHGGSFTIGAYGRHSYQLFRSGSP